MSPPARILEDAGSSFIVFADDWGDHMSSAQHIFRQIATERRVLWVNTIGMRNLTLSSSDMRKAWRKLSRVRWRQPQSTPQDIIASRRVRVCQPLMLPFVTNAAVRRFNARSVAKAVESHASEFGVRQPIVVSTVPNVGDYEQALKDRRVVYYCVDDFTLWPGLEVELIREMEARLIARADILVGVSEYLCSRLSASGKPTYLLTHGVDINLFSAGSRAEHRCLRNIPRPRAGFIGLIDGRVDQRLMCEVAKRMPNMSFVFAGPCELSTAACQKSANIHFVGALRYLDLPSFISGVDVLMMPYKTGTLADALSPLKLKEYLVTGKPVVSTPVREVYEWSNFVKIAADVDAWQRALAETAGIDAEVRRESISAMMRGHSWESKAKKFIEICNG